MYDVAIIGAGVTGCAVARYLARYRVRACVIERGEDVCCGTSKANSAIVHAGFDAVPGTKKALYNVRGNAMMENLSRELDFPFRRNGSLVVCTKAQNPSRLVELSERAEKNGVPDVKILGREELLELEPNLADDVVCALYAPTGGIVCPFHLTMALAENAADNGVEFQINTEVLGIRQVPVPREGEPSCFEILTDKGVIDARAVVNAAGVYADALNNMVSERKLHITPRRGQYMLLDKNVGNHVSHTVFQLPSKMGKGVLVTPTIHGNLLVGPTAEDVEEKEMTNTTMAGLADLSAKAGLSVKNVPFRQVITSFAGLRAHEDGDDFIIGEAPDVPNFFNVAGIESPGLSAAPAIGESVADQVAQALGLEKNPDFNGTRKGILNPARLKPEERNALIKEKPAYGQIICRCEMISEGEILDAIHRTLGARSLDGVKRRTRAGMGRCQSGFCMPRVMEILEREVPMDAMEVTKSGGKSTFVVGHDKEI